MSLSLLNGDPLTDGLPTLAALVAERLQTAWDYEAVAPDDVLVAGAARIYLSHAPHTLPLTDGLRINAAAAGGTPVTVQVYAGGAEMLSAPATLTGETQLIPLSAILPARRTLAAGARLEVRVISAPGGYNAWHGLRVAFLGRQALSASAPSSAGLQLRYPDFALWVRDWFKLVEEPVPTNTAVAFPGAAIAHWPERNSLLMLDRPGFRLLEVSLEGDVIRWMNLFWESHEPVSMVMTGADKVGMGDKLADMERLWIYDLSDASKWDIEEETQTIWDTWDVLDPAFPNLLARDRVTGGMLYLPTQKAFVVDDIYTQPLRTRPMTGDAGGQSTLCDLWLCLPGYLEPLALESTPQGTILLLARREANGPAILHELSRDGRVIQAVKPHATDASAIALNGDGTRLYTSEPPPEDGQGAALQRFTRPL